MFIFMCEFDNARSRYSGVQRKAEPTATRYIVRGNDEAGVVPFLPTFLGITSGVRL